MGKKSLFFLLLLVSCYSTFAQRGKLSGDFTTAADAFSAAADAAKAFHADSSDEALTTLNEVFVDALESARAIFDGKIREEYDLVVESAKAFNDSFNAFIAEKKELQEFLLAADRDPYAIRSQGVDLYKADIEKARCKIVEAEHSLAIATISLARVARGDNGNTVADLIATSLLAKDEDSLRDVAQLFLEKQ